jgi:hypothetical protein
MSYSSGTCVCMQYWAHSKNTTTQTHKLLFMNFYGLSCALVCFSSRYVFVYYMYSIVVFLLYVLRVTGTVYHSIIVLWGCFTSSASIRHPQALNPVKCARRTDCT